MVIEFSNFQMRRWRQSWPSDHSSRVVQCH